LSSLYIIIITVKSELSREPPKVLLAVGKGSGQTSHIERWFNTLRQRLARFVRKTLSFSKSDHFHEWAFRLFVHHYHLAYIS